MLELAFKNPETTIIIINTLFVIVSYFLIYPKFVKGNLNKLMIFDFFISILSLIVAGLIFYDKNIEFYLFFFSTNWFWFSLVIYFILETAWLFWYKDKYSINITSLNDNK